LPLGRDCFQRLYDDFVDDYKICSQCQRRIEVIQKSYEAFYGSGKLMWVTTLEALYNIVKFVDRSEFNDKRIYTNLIRAPAV